MELSGGPHPAQNPLSRQMSLLKSIITPSFAFPVNTTKRRNDHRLFDRRCTAYHNNENASIKK
jgi:hypothetical protein